MINALCLHTVEDDVARPGDKTAVGVYMYIALGIA